MFRGETTRVRADENDNPCTLPSDTRDFGRWLSEVSLCLCAARTLEECLDLCLCSLEQVVEYDIAGISFLDGDFLVAAATRGCLVDEGSVPGAVHVGQHPHIPALSAEDEPLTGADGPPEHPWLVLGTLPAGGAWLLAPLRSRGRLIGQLAVYRQEGGEFGRVDQRRVGQMAPHMAMALHSARRILEAHRETDALLLQGKQLRRLLETLPRLSAELAPDVLLSRVLEQALVAVPTAQSGLLFVPDKELLVCQATEGYDLGTLLGQQIPMAALMLSGRTLRFPQRLPRARPWWSKTPAKFQQALTSARLEEVGDSPSSLVVPIRLAQELLSVLVLENWDGQVPFAEMAIEIADLFAAQSAVAITNARLYHVVREYATTLESRVQERTAEIRESKERSEAILRSVADGVVVTDLGGEIVEVNPVAARWLEYCVDERRYPNRRVRQFIAAVARGSAHGSPNLVEFPVYPQAEDGSCISSAHCDPEACPLRPRDGAPCWLVRGLESASEGDSDPCVRCTHYARLDKVTLQAHAAPIRSDGESVIGTVIVLRDISQLRQLDRLKSQFVSNVSHELRTPLSNIKLYLSLLRRGRLEKKEHYLNILDEETNRLSKLIEDLLDLSTLETGKRPSGASQQSWLAILPQVLETYRPQLEARRLELETELAADTPPVWADRNQLIQVLTNLICNAVNYTQPHGRIWIRTEGLREGEHLWSLLTVEDTGVGISEFDLGHIFDRFYRGAAEGLGVPGSGLGLTIVKEIVELYGGRIAVESELGEGSSFTVYLPASTEARTSADVD